MREGPLAALFRKTAQDSGEKAESKTRDSAPSRGRAGREQQQPRQQAASVEKSRAAQPSRAGDEGRGAEKVRGAVREGTPAAVSEQSAPAPPSPQERLRNAFSADIPENMLERPRRRGTPDEDVYARAESAGQVFGVAAPVSRPVIRVVGVGGAGVNAVNRMVEAEIEGVEFLAINTDLQSLQQCAAQDTLHIGDSLTRGLGSGSDPDLGRRAARDEYDRIKAMMRGSDLVFIAAGAGGGTGTGAAPVIAEIAREIGALTVGIVTRPFAFEGNRRREQAEAGIAELAREVDTLIVVPNNRLLSVLDRNTSMVEAFRVADDVLRQGVQGIADLVTLPGLINLDFADVRTIMSDAGTALLGIGMGTGERRAIDAAEHAVSSPLLETSMEGARSILLSITGGRDLGLWEINEAAKAVAEAAHPEANIIFGAMVDERLDEQVWVTVVATRYGNERPPRREHASPGVPEWSQQTRSLREPSGEPRVTRVRPGGGSRAGELDVPEFIPRR